MSFNSLSGLLNQLEAKYPQWDSYRQYRRLLLCWGQVVSTEVAKQSRPLYLNRGVLSVATASAAWAQTLSLQRYQLIQKLSPVLDEPLIDMRFSTVQWTQSRTSPLVEKTVNFSHSESCPKCQVLVKRFEIERWGVCSCCIAQIWSNKSQGSRE